MASRTSAQTSAPGAKSISAMLRPFALKMGSGARPERVVANWAQFSTPASGVTPSLPTFASVAASSAVQPAGRGGAGSRAGVPAAGAPGGSASSQGGSATTSLLGGEWPRPGEIRSVAQVPQHLLAAGSAKKCWPATRPPEMYAVGGSVCAPTSRVLPAIRRPPFIGLEPAKRRRAVVMRDNANGSASERAEASPEVAAVDFV